MPLSPTLKLQIVELIRNEFDPKPDRFADNWEDRADEIAEKIYKMFVDKGLAS